jgi:cold shock CspA family protein/ribosome-associated translation inhibitor RaiA
MSVEDYVIERLQKLDRLAEGVTSCRVTLKREQSSHHQGNLYSVLVEVRTPPQHDLTAKKQKQIRDMSAQLPALINQAFTAIERQLKKTAERRRHEEKSHQSEFLGIVEKLFMDGYGFIRTLRDNQQYYFHRNSVLHGDFGSLSIGAEVRFSPEEGQNGPQANSVQIVSKVGPRIFHDNASAKYRPAGNADSDLK